MIKWCAAPVRSSVVIRTWCRCIMLCLIYRYSCTALKLPVLPTFQNVSFCAKMDWFAFEMTHEKSLSWWHIFVCKRSRHNDQCFDLDYTVLFSHFFTGCGLCKYLARNDIVSPELAQNSRNIDRRAILPTSHPIISESNSDDAFQWIEMHQNASKSTSRGSLLFGGLRDGSRSPLDVALRYSD